MAPAGLWVFNPYDLSSGGWPPPFAADPGPPFHGWKPLFDAGAYLTVYHRSQATGQTALHQVSPLHIPFGQSATGNFYGERDWDVNDFLDFQFWPSFNAGSSVPRAGMTCARRPIAAPSAATHRTRKTLNAKARRTRSREAEPQG